MSISYVRNVISAGYNLAKINQNFENIETALANAVSRAGTSPNQMDADFDMNSNDIMNAGSIATQSLSIAGIPVFPSTGILVNAPDVRNFLDTAPYVATRTAAKALDTTKDTTLILTEAGREGVFMWTTGNYSAQIAADTAGGIYLKADAVASTSGAWVRVNHIPQKLEWFGGGGSVADNKAAFDGLMAATSSSGAEIELTAGTTYIFTTQPAAFSKPLKITGPGKGLATIKCNYASGHLFDGGNYFRGQGFTISSDIVRTGGAYLRSVGIYCSFVDIGLFGYATGIDIDGGVIHTLSAVEGRNPVNFGGFIQIGMTAPNPVVEVTISNCVADTDNGNTPDFGIRIGNADAVNIMSCDIIRHGRDLWITPPAGKVVSSIKAVATYFDTANYGVLIEPGAGSTVQFLEFLGCWASGHTQSGFYCSPGSGNIDGVTLIGHQGCLNTNHGVVADTATKNFRCYDGIFAANGGSGIEIAAGVIGAKIKNNRCGPTDNQAGNTRYGVEVLAGAGDFIEIVGNDIRGNTAGALSFGATGLNNIVKDNLGYNDTTEYVVAAIDPNRNWAAITAPYKGDAFFIDNVLSIQNKSIGAPGRGNAALNFLDSAGVERAAIGYSRNSLLLPNAGYIPNAVYIEDGNPFTSDAAITDFVLRATIAAGSAYFSGAAVAYDVIRHVASTGEIQFNAWVSGASTRALTMTDYAGLLVGQSATSAGADGQLSVTSANNSRTAFTAKQGTTATIPAGIMYHPATSGDNQFLHFATESTYTQRGSITYNRGSGVVAYNTTSDYRAKTVLGDIENAVDRVLALSPRRAIMHGGEQEIDCFVAHELQEIAPYAVTGVKDAMKEVDILDEAGGVTGKEIVPDYQQIDASKLIPLLVAAIKEQAAKINELSRIVAEME